MDLAMIFLAYPAARWHSLGGTVSGSPSGQLVVVKNGLVLLELRLLQILEPVLSVVHFPDYLVLLFYKPHGLSTPGKAQAPKWST